MPSALDHVWDYELGVRRGVRVERRKQTGEKMFFAVVNVLLFAGYGACRYEDGYFDAKEDYACDCGGLE